MIQNSVWGPPLWRILHTLADRLGANSNPLVATDEARSWQQLLKVVEPIMPCPLCRRHFRNWKLSHPVEPMSGARGSYLRELAIEWLFTLHNNVNRERGMPEMAREEVDALYKGRSSTDLNQDVAALTASLMVATQTGASEPNAVRVWKAALSLLRRLLGI